MITTINTPEELTTHIEKLLLIEPRFLPIYTRVGVPTLRRQRGGFSQLMRAIVGQQLSTASANSIWERLEKSELTSAAPITQSSDETLRSHGLSKQKIRYVRSIIEHDIDADVLAVDDLAVKVATMDLLELTARPTPKQLKSLTSHWSPHRSAASLLLWEHYGWQKSRLDN